MATHAPSRIRADLVDDPEGIPREAIVSWILSAIAFGVFLLGLVSEIRGWWSDTDALILDLGGVAGLLLAIVGVRTSSSRGEVRRVAADVGAANVMLRSMDAKRDTLDKSDKLDEIDVIEAQLNIQSGALGRQVAILTQIRDRL